MASMYDDKGNNDPREGIYLEMATALAQKEFSQIEKVAESIYPGVMKSLQEERVCARCDKFYTQQENLGAWKCHYHPGVPIGWNHSGRYTCCDKSMFINEKNPDRPTDFFHGCKRCDHTMGTYSQTRNIPNFELPKMLLSFIKNSRPESIVREYYIDPRDITTLVVAIRRWE